MGEDAMVRSGTPDGASDQQSLGDLVSLALKDLSQLLHYEISLAKSELRMDVRRAGVSGALGGLALVMVALIMFVLCFAYAYGLYAAGAPGGLWGAFLWVALTLVVLLAIALAVAYLIAKRITGMAMTRKTVSDDLSLLRGGDASPDGETPAITNPTTGTGSVGAGTQAEITARPLPGVEWPCHPNLPSRSAGRGRIVRSALTGHASTWRAAATGRSSCCCTAFPNSGGRGGIS
jgi:membrane protein implicated in regulation of membrane protease activity